ncbi:hypothetical protein NP233_g4409 [Leucocoprinus birnbaumii]|uniref:Uncharacterized protein n=1 Tax=Leucocoprinus birnbaumii TaxID=56174 RepID=A0AAD5VUP9_9AGAR|nr:hypothetical protein NP233_g4409 [Leucocoprinus birnbaumii]
MVFLPVSHLGGDIVLRHPAKDPFIFNDDVYRTTSGGNHVAWLAFHDNVDVELVNLHRGAVVYHCYELFWKKAISHYGERPLRNPSAFRSQPFLQALQQCLTESSFKHEHRFLAFALQNTYDIAITDTMDTESLCFYLKDSDKELAQTLRSAGMKLRLKFFYREGTWPTRERPICLCEPGFVIMRSNALEEWEKVELNRMHGGEVAYLMEEIGAKLVFLDNSPDEMEGEPPNDSAWLAEYQENVRNYFGRRRILTWVVPLGSSNIVATTQVVHDMVLYKATFYYQQGLVAEQEEGVD